MPKWFQTTAIDYPNSRPHIGTAFEKLGADVQAHYTHFYREEQSAYDRAVTDWERWRYFERI